MPHKLLHIQKVTAICGSENHLLKLLPQLNRSKYAVTFLALEDPEKPMDEYLNRLKKAGVNTARMTIFRDISPGLVFKLWRFIRRGGYDLVHTHLIHADLYGALAAWLVRVKLVSSKHGCNEFRRGVIGRIDRLAAGYAKKVIAISQAVRKFYEKVEKIPSEKIEVIFYGFDSAKIEASNRREIHGCPDVPRGVKVLINVARLVPFKNHICLLEAIAELQRANYKIMLWLVGDGPLEDELRERVCALGIEDCVHFLGFRRDVLQLLHGADIFVFPSYNEGFGLVLLEAMACGLPVVACRAQAIPEVVLHQNTGLLVEPENCQALAFAIGKLLNDYELYRQMGYLGQQRVAEHFSVQKMVRHTEALYDQLLTEGDNANA